MPTMKSNYINDLFHYKCYSHKIANGHFNGKTLKPKSAVDPPTAHGCDCCLNVAVKIFLIQFILAVAF